jgi:hypothetical protein
MRRTVAAARLCRAEGKTSQSVVNSAGRRYQVEIGRRFGATWLTYPDLASRAGVIFSTVMSRKGFVKLCLEMRSHFSKRISNWPIRNAKSPSARGTTPVGASGFVDQQQFAWPSWLGLIVHFGLNMHKQVTSLLKTVTKMVGQRRVTFQLCLS